MCGLAVRDIIYMYKLYEVNLFVARLTNRIAGLDSARFVANN